jgi:hypothetical protein
MTNLKKYFLSIESVLLLGFLLLFVFTAPYTVQSGDTGELVTNSYFLRVSHPPGYPLWTLLYHLPVRYLSFSTPFHIAALVTSLISVFWLALLLFRFRNNASMGLTVVLGTSLVFWRYSVLPDVFSLHIFFLVLVFIVFMEPELLEKPWVIFLVSLCVANHHTIVFAFPMYVYAVARGNIKKKIIYSLIFGFLSVSIYFLLMLFHPDDYGSWGNMKSINAVVHHFLRSEYGTFRLISQDEGSDPVWIHLFLKNLLTNSWSMVLALGYVLFRGWNKLRPHLVAFGVVAFSLMAYIITFLIGGVISLNGLGETLFERFLIQPVLMLFFIVLMAINLAGIQLPRWLILAFLVNGGLNVIQNFQTNDYRRNTDIEDFSLNIFNSLPDKSIYYSYGDTQGSAAYYLHDVLKIRPDVIHLQPTMTFMWSVEKAEKKFPHAINTKNKKLIEDLNLEDYNFFINFPPAGLPDYFKVTYYGIVFKVTKVPEKRPLLSYECDISQSYVWRNRPEIQDFSSFEVSRFYDLEYGRCDYTFALELLKLGNVADATRHLEKAMELSSYSAKFLERLCHVYKSTGNSKAKNCFEQLEELIAGSNRQYYLYEYER